MTNLVIPTTVYSHCPAVPLIWSGFSTFLSSFPIVFPFLLPSTQQTQETLSGGWPYKVRLGGFPSHPHRLGSAGSPVQWAHSCFIPPRGRFWTSQLVPLASKESTQMKTSQDIVQATEQPVQKHANKIHKGNGSGTILIRLALICSTLQPGR